MEKYIQGIIRGSSLKQSTDYITQKRILESFNHYVDDLITHIRQITDENPDPQMAANKTKRIIDKWFKHGGKI